MFEACSDRFIVITNGRLREGALWDYANILSVPRPGHFIVRMCPDLLSDLQRETGVISVSQLHDPS